MRVVHRVTCAHPKTMAHRIAVLVRADIHELPAIQQRYKTCHCDTCKRGNTLRMQNYRGSLPRSAKHPSRAAYMRGCSCDDCKALNTEYGREYRALRKRLKG